MLVTLWGTDDLRFSLNHSNSDILFVALKMKIFYCLQTLSAINKLSKIINMNKFMNLKYAYGIGFLFLFVTEQRV